MEHIEYYAKSILMATFICSLDETNNFDLESDNIILDSLI